ncbi:hypothetical protein H072_3782 [Dactylellina haptotyla CBS 200.50]|uniref:Uncharacterized protein n=1 Tax=Dactylellina haptotyla (strain CBS 200.50) TaxID=1284197 RepID=S8AH85_DACHA|nr:hypothetical protein H072_3782 [Dactylellina haptotyla CBS 200.50]
MDLSSNPSYTSTRAGRFAVHQFQQRPIAPRGCSRTDIYINRANPHPSQDDPSTYNQDTDTDTTYCSLSQQIEDANTTPTYHGLFRSLRDQELEMALRGTSSRERDTPPRTPPGEFASDVFWGDTGRGGGSSVDDYSAVWPDGRRPHRTSVRAEDAQEEWEVLVSREYVPCFAERYEHGDDAESDVGSDEYITVTLDELRTWRDRLGNSGGGGRVSAAFGAMRDPEYGYDYGGHRRRGYERFWDREAHSLGAILVDPARWHMNRMRGDGLRRRRGAGAGDSDSESSGDLSSTPHLTLARPPGRRWRGRATPVPLPREDDESYDGDGRGSAAAWRVEGFENDYVYGLDDDSDDFGLDGTGDVVVESPEETGNREQGEEGGQNGEQDDGDGPQVVEVEEVPNSQLAERNTQDSSSNGREVESNSLEIPSDDEAGFPVEEVD